ncbi:MAG: hypothetical protein QNJ77_15000 [Acidimicrobiia bacterium]|nr:hypothetical protein [Acidimicrobiia bacterium]
MFRPFAILVLLGVLTGGVAGCADTAVTPPGDVTTTNPPATSPPASTTTTAPASTQPASPCLTGDRPFSSSGVISAFGGASGDAVQISGLRAARHPGCERIVLDLLTADGAPAGSLGLVGVEYDSEIGIVRINLPPSITVTSVADLLLDGDLADRAYVVQTSEGNLALDIHAVPGSSVALRAFEMTGPSRIVVDLKTDTDVPPVQGVASNDYVVVTNPASGPGKNPLLVTGYARPGISQVEVSIHDHAASDPAVTTPATVAGSNQAWGEFSVGIVDPLSGTHELFVGEPSSRQDSSGVWISIDTGPAQELDESDT